MDEEEMRMLWGQNDNLTDDQKKRLDDMFNIDNFDEELEDDVPDYEDLDEEEILARQKELYNLSDEGKEMLRDIRGLHNSRIIKMDSLVFNSVKLVQDSDDEIDDVEFSPEYLKFITWFDDERREGTLYIKYLNNIDRFEEALNDGLENEDEDNIFAYFKKKYIEKVRGVVKDIDEPLSGLEVEAANRFEILSNSEKDLISLFNNINNLPEEYYDNGKLSWETLKSLL